MDTSDDQQPGAMTPLAPEQAESQRRSSRLGHHSVEYDLAHCFGRTRVWSMRSLVLISRPTAAYLALTCSKYFLTVPCFTPSSPATSLSVDPDANEVKARFP